VAIPPSSALVEKRKPSPSGEDEWDEPIEKRETDSVQLWLWKIFLHVPRREKNAE
jgi:hypothetical protein